ncbi:hypothetical protein [Neolewinella sp.]|uniref:PIN-like domain-containing protein n=1 Tax=Neolewinella sp. TaxID=2993543 RepID=UPI003B5276B1
MTIFVDENIPEHVAESFNILQIPEGLKSGYPIVVKYTPTVFGRGAKDVEWIPGLGKEAYVITQDVSISLRKHEQELYRKHGIGMFYLRGSSRKQGLSVWEMVQALAKNWPTISRLTHEERRPFEYQITLSRGIKRL